MFRKAQTAQYKRPLSPQEELDRRPLEYFGPSLGWL
jgi:hypothetical protein